MTGQRTLVIVAGDGLEHRYVVNEIARHFAVSALLIADPPARRSWKKVWNKAKREFADKALWKLYLALIKDQRSRDRDLVAVLGQGNCDQFNAELNTIRVGKPKAGKLEAELARLTPDYIAVYGTGIIPDAALRQARVMAFNMHTGISPFYRGTACAFWPIYHGEPELIGATVHECTSKVDGGMIFRVARAKLFRGDTVHKVFARAVRAGAQAYVEVLRDAFADKLAGSPQDMTLGREFSGRMRGFRAEIATRLKLVLMRRKWDVEQV